MRYLALISTALLSLALFFVSETATAQETESEILGSAEVGFLCSGMREEPSISSDKILDLESGSEVQIHNFYEEPYLKVSVDSTIGYASKSCFESNSTITELVYADNMSMIINTDLYGESSAIRIENGEIWVGMTEEMLLKSRGTPDSKNVTQSVYGNREQWVYRKSNYKTDYVYLENGVVETIQRSE